MEYALNAANAISQTRPVREVGDALFRAADVITTPLQHVLSEHLGGTFAALNFSLIDLGVASVIAMVIIVYYVLRTS